MTDFAREMDEAIQSGLDEFKAFIQKKIGENKDFLKQSFWLLQNSAQMTVLNYLIDVHQEEPQKAQQETVGTDNEESQELQSDVTDEYQGDLTEFIDYVLEHSEDKNVGEPLHQAIATGKFQLAFHLLNLDIDVERPLTEKRDKLNLQRTLERLRKEAEFDKFDLDRRDIEGRTLISLILDFRIFELLMYLIAGRANIHAATPRSGSRVRFQPLHQAIVLDSADAVRLLASQGAQLSNPLGVMRDTPLILAARLGKLSAMEALLEFPVAELDLEAENKNRADDETGRTAMEELCHRIANNEDRDEAIRGVAMLFCRGAEPPRSEEMRTLLTDYRIDLLKAIDQYLGDKPALVDAFVSRCHVIESTLHNIIYADHSWGSSIRHLFGVPSDAAFMVENLVTRKYDAPQIEHPNVVPLSSATASDFQQEKDSLKLYAEFVRRYTKAYDNQIFTNRWSTMRWMIAEGNCNWQRVVEYAKNHPTSRTRIVLGDMLQPIPNVHIDVEERPTEELRNQAQI
ncbi:Dot/Icm T4SS effector AnkC/LegA12 [Legionella fallonii]|uniref:Uncharacterized protein n=1 Tax=Legionella fallonii LLAP-10 TaxID=1212491 RepID=A0A098G7R8_9GAMM|nr:Dot/Icm T4SS effector AnkC/LegA12 [Legionella fallonii]CEG58009.1 conserved protein of unknown function [ankyrin repeat] [Legionella fallonii LLAP-10]